MESPPRLELVFLLLVTFSSVFAVPLSNNECATQCTEKQKLFFKPGTTYTYDYETLMTTVVKGTSKDQSQLQMRAQVDIEVLSKCEFSLRLRGVTLKQTDLESPDYLSSIRGGREFSRTVEKHILRFSWQDGRVEHLCPSESTPSWITNIHRGILSALQNSMNSMDKDEKVIETDVAGTCPVDYHSLGRSWRGVLRIRKIKDLNSCTNRHSASTSLQAIPFDHLSSIQSQPLVSGTQECEQSIGEGIVQTSSCTEEHIFRPFSRGGGGVTTTVHQKLTFATTSKRSFTGNDYRPTKVGLVFKHEEPVITNEDQVEIHMKELCDASQNEITISVPERFASLVYKLRTLDYRTLSDFYRRVDSICPNNPKAKKFFMDAVPIISTAASIRFMSDMINRQEVSKAEADFWFTSFSFVTEPTPEMISHLTPLIDGRYDQALLGVSSLVHTFCKTNDCGTIPEVRELVRRLVDILGESCYNPEVKKILLTLKAIGNIGIPFGRESILERCYKNPQLKMEVRLAAIQSYRRFSCDISRNTFLETYRNYDEDTEIRIASYLAVSTCFTPENLQEIKNTLENERVNQVGSFVWTHLQALAKSRHPERREIKDLVSNLYLLNKYHPDSRKFSSAREASLYLDSINSGFHFDTHVIFPTHSFLPHSASLNLTVDIFGHSCNLLQVDGRMEGMEHVMEKFFGPSGYFPQKHVSKLLRQRRSISDNKIERMDSQFDAKSKFEEKPYGSLDVKIFGNTLWFNQFEENDNSQTATNLMDLIADLAQKHEKEYSRSFMFLDTTYSIPIASGLPLRLALNGTANVNLKLGGRFNIRSMQNVDILAHVEPSGAVQLAGLLTIEAGNAARTGMRVAATLHTSTVMDTKFEVRNGEMVKTEINMPREKIEVIDLQTRLYLVYGKDEREPTRQLEDGFHVSSCTPNDSLRNILGIELCADIHLPGGKSNTPIYPMNGPSTVSLYLKKTDPTLSKYTFDSTWENKMVNGKYIRQGFISLNTPQSTVDREIKLHYNLNQPDGIFTFEAKTPVKKMSLAAKYINTTPTKKVDMSISIDDKNKFSLRSEFQTKVEKGSVSYFPSLEVSIPSKKLITLSGSTHFKYGQKYGGQLVIQDITEKPITLKGNFDIQSNAYDGEVSINSYPLDAVVKGYSHIGDTTSAKITADYKIMNGKTYKVNIHGKVRDLSAHSLKKYTGVLNLQASAIPEWDTSVSWETMHTTGHLENTFSFTIGDPLKTRAHTINFQEIIKYSGSLYNNNIETTFKMAYPQKNINYGFQMIHHNTQKTLKNSIEIQYDINRQITTSTELVYEPSKLFTGATSLKYPGRDAKVTVNIKKDNLKDYKLDTSLQWQRNKKASLKAHYRDRSDSSRTKYESELEITLPSQSPIRVTSSVGILRDQYTGYVEVKYAPNKFTKLDIEYTQREGIDHSFSVILLVPGETYLFRENLQATRDKITGTADLKFANKKQISSRFEIKSSRLLKTGYFETSWDTDRDSSNKFALNSEMRTHSNGHDIKFTMQIKKRNIRGILSTNTEGKVNGGFFKSLHRVELEWSPREKATMNFNTIVAIGTQRKQISSNLEITTPYYGYEKMTLSLNHASVPQEWNSDLTALWGNNKKISLSTEGKYALTRDAFLEASVSLINPWTDYERLSFNVSHYQSSNQFSNNIQFQYNPRSKIASEITAFLADTEFKGKIKLITPFANARDMHVEINHNYMSGAHKGKIEVQWANQQKINAELDFKHMKNGRRQTCSFGVTANSPFKDYENILSKISYSNDGSTLNTDAEIHWSKYKKITLGLMKVDRNTFINKNLEVTAYFASPFKGYEDLKLASSFQKNSEAYKLNTDIKLPNEMTASFNSDAKFTSWQNVEFNTVLTGNFMGKIKFERMSIDLVHKNQDNNVRSSFNGIYNQKQVTVLLTGSMKSGYNSEIIEGILSAKTPFRGYEVMSINIEHDRKDLQWTTKVQAKRNIDKYNLVHSATIDTLNTNIETNTILTIDIRNSKPAIYKYSTSHAQTSSYLSHVTVIEWKTNKMDFNVKYDGKLSGKELEIKISSPFESIRNFDFLLEHRTSRSEFKTNINSHLNSDKTVSIQSKIINFMFKKMDAEIDVNTNIYGIQKYGMSGKYDITELKKTAQLSYYWNQNKDKKVELVGSFIPSTTSPEITLKATTPFNKFEKLSFNTVAENTDRRKKLSLALERNREKFEIESEIYMERNKGNGFFSFNAPVKNYFISANYEKGYEWNFNGGTKIQWNKSNEIELIFKSLSEDKTFEIKTTLMTPFKNYKDLSLDINTDMSGNKNTANIILRKNSEKIETYLECQVKKGKEGNYKIQFKSPFRNMKNIVLESNYKKEYGKFNSMFKSTIGNDVYDGSVAYSNDGEMQELFTIIHTPHFPYKTIELSSTLRNGYSHQEFKSSLRNDEKNVDISLGYKVDRQNKHEIQFDMNTPFESFKNFKAEGSLKYPNNNEMECDLEILTPFPSLNKVTFLSQFKSDKEFYDIKISGSIPQKKVTASGQLSKNMRKPLEASINIDAPFLKVNNFAVKAKIDHTKGWRNAVAGLQFFTQTSQHSLNANIRVNTADFSASFDAQSPLITDKNMNLKLRVNYPDIRNMNAEIVCNIFRERHSLDAKYIQNRHEIITETKVASPLLSEGNTGFKIVYMQRHRLTECKISIDLLGSSHLLTGKIKLDNEASTAVLSLDSNLISPSKIEINGKYINAFGRDMEVSLETKTSTGKHSIIANLKNYDSDKSFQIEVNCPWLKMKQFSVTGTLKNNAYNAMEGSITVNTEGKELRIATNMKRMGWKDAEALIILNTPFERLSMLRIDTAFKNKDLKDVEFNFKMDTRFNRKQHNTGFTAKLIRGIGTEDLSLNLRLPVTSYPKIEFLTSIHYEPDMKIADSRVSLLLSPDKYSLFGSYQIQNNGIAVNSEIEYLNNKYLLSCQGKLREDLKGISTMIQIPNVGIYTAGISTSCSNTRHTFSMNYGSPYHNSFNTSIVMNYISSSDIDIGLTASTPVQGYNQIHARVKHQRQERKRFFVEAEFSANEIKSVINIFHRTNRTNYLSSMRIGSPFEVIRNFEFTVSKTHDREGTVDITYNNKRYLNGEMSTIRGTKTFVIDLPTLPVTISTKSKLTNFGRELSIKSNYPSRTMSFNLVEQDTSQFWSQEAVLVWDESSRRQMSYNVKLSDIAKGQSGKELFARINFPIRSLELKGKFTGSSKVKSCGMDFYWDASRDSTKHMAFGIEHQDLTTSSETSHKLQITLIHPTLPKDLELINIFTLSSSELLCRSELQYSSQQERHFIAEFKGINMQYSHKNLHYRGELSLRHPVSKLLVKATTELLNSPKESMLELSFNKMDRKGRTSTHEIRTKFSKAKKQVDILMKSNDNYVTFLAKRSDQVGITTYSVHQKINDKPALQAHFNLDYVIEFRSAEFNINYADVKGVTLSVTAKQHEASARLQRYDELSTVTLASAYLGLERARILRSKATWKPGLWREIRIATGNTLRGIAQEISTTAKLVRFEANEEYQQNLQDVHKELRTKLQPFISSLTREMDSINKDFEIISNTLNTMYRKNEFFSEDIVKGIYATGRALEEFVHIMELVVEVATNIFIEFSAEFFENLYYNLEDLSIYIKDMFANFAENCCKITKVISQKVRESYEYISDVLRDYTKSLTKRITLMMEQVKENLEEYSKHFTPYFINSYWYMVMVSEKIRDNIVIPIREKIVKSPFCIAVGNYMERIIITIRTFQTADLISTLQSRVLFLGEHANTFLNRLSDIQVVNMIRDRIPVDYVMESAKVTLQKGVELYSTLGIDKIVKGLFSYAVEETKALILSSGQELLNEAYQIKTGAKYDFDMKRGQMSFEYTLPTSKNGIYEVFQLTEYPEIKKLSELKNVLLTKYYKDFCIWDMYYKIKNFFSPKYWMLPFSAQAMIAGNQHYVTFDKLAFDFAGECSYLLARDFVDGNFTIVANYKREHGVPVRKSLSIRLDRDTFEIVNDYRLTHNGVKVEMPVRFGRTVARRIGPNVRIENYHKGFVVVCNFALEICTFGMSGYYFGKTGGLFGTYDYEPLLDMMTPLKSLTTDVETFANSWEVGQTNCRSRENLATKPGNSRSAKKKCESYFEQPSSPFRACFKQVDPEPYLRMCINDLSVVHDPKYDTAICTSAAAYFTECKIANVQLKMPTSCIRCETTSEKPMQEGDSITFTKENPSHAADIVFVVEEKKCNAENLKYLPKLAHSIEDNFRQKGFLDIRYRIVGFGGPDIHAEPHVHTIDGQEYGNVRSLEHAFESLQIGEGPVNMLEALRFAASLNYRAGTSKTFILIKCSTCKSEESRAEYGEMSRTLLDNNINLHLLMEQKYEMRIANKNSKAKKVIGLDKNFAYTLKDIKDSNIFGDEDLLLQLKVPKDVCIPLALDASGSTFDLQYLTETKRNTYKKFMDVFARRMVKSATHTPSGGICCECISTEDGIGKSTCQKCVSTEMNQQMANNSSEDYTSRGW